IIAVRRTFWRFSSSLKPGMLIRSVVNNQLGNYPHITLMSFFQQLLKLLYVAISGIYAVIISNIISVVFQRRRIKWKDPDGRNPQALQIIQFLKQPFKIANPIPIAVAKCFDMQFVDYSIFIPM